MSAARRKIIVYIATSADGFIARRDGGVEWLNRPRVGRNYDMAEFYESIDAILWGRKTLYPKGLSEKPVTSLASYGRIKNYIFSRTPPAVAPAGAEFVSDPIARFAERLRAAPGKDIWMMGGGEIIGSFLDEAQIDEFIINVIPIFIGEGIPLIAPRHRAVPLHLLSLKRFEDGVVRLHYRVDKAPSAGPRKRARKQ